MNAFKSLADVAENICLKPWKNDWKIWNKP